MTAIVTSKTSGILRYIGRYKLPSGRYVRMGNTFTPSADGARVMAYYAAPHVDKGGKYEGAQVQFAACVFDHSKPVKKQRAYGVWTPLDLS